MAAGSWNYLRTRSGPQLETKRLSISMLHSDPTTTGADTRCLNLNRAPIVVVALTGLRK
ncbi:uncharacterized protein ARMOST_07614 [Armillaria ostoyae]|uniref:Uncharacterized protein n=1 Tax=Armillaria ostoyae TaxID=47428 RepID=A0A284R6A8_ARMOS|nr:uncharacterized protein ARMOST_07614 [Armillaria ostoyae]